MRVRIGIGVIVTAFALVACSSQTKPVAETSAAPPPPDTSTAAATPAATTAAAPATGEKPSRDFVVGKWGTNGDCTLAIDLRPDGSSDGPFGNWTYRDGVIGFADEPDFTVSVTVLDPNTMESTNESGKKSKMTRCP